MNRREFLKLSALTATLPLAVSPRRFARAADLPTTAPAPANFDRYFNPIVEGFIRNAKATSRDYVVCDFPDGTRLKSCCTPSGKTYVSVARMLPALVESSDPRHLEIVASIFRHAFDPRHAHFWGYAPPDRPTQRSVEAALVAHALCRAPREILANLSSEQRANIQKWLASCTQVAERKNNHAWFTACNQAARLELSRTFDEFSGDEAWMLADLAAMDALAAAGTTEDGWYTDSPDQPIYDVYNFYVFPNFPLMWGAMVGARYPDWNDRFRGRIEKFLERTPYFFAANGAHPLMGRSLIYRWAVLSPLVLGYREKLWPHSAGLLRRIVRKQLEYHGSLGCFDERRGKLREGYSREETPAAREGYIDNGHPYWAMLGFAFLGIRRSDPFWTADEEPLPVEQGDFQLTFDGPKFLLTGTQRTGEVRWTHSLNAPKREPYRDKYAKFCWSSHFAFNSSGDRENVPPDQALVFRNVETGACATRAVTGIVGGAAGGRLLPGAAGVETTWFAQLGDWRFDVVSRIRILGEYEERTHRITAPAAAVGKVELIEGTYAVPPDGPEMIHLWPIAGYEKVEEQTLENVNLIHRSVRLLKTTCRLTATETTVASLHFASPKPPPKEEMIRRGEELKKTWKP